MPEKLLPRISQPLLTLTSLSAVFLVLLTFASGYLPAAEPSESHLEWTKIATLPAVGGQREALGVAGPYVGVHRGALIVAGGANFDLPVWSTEKVWHDEIHVLLEANGTFTWKDGGRLPRPLGYGAVVSTPEGVLCVGGNDAAQTYADVFLLQWDPAAERVLRRDLPRLPSPCAYGAATLVGSYVYLAGGTSGPELSTAMRNFWRLDLARIDDGWQELPAWPGPTRGFNLTLAQHDGVEDRIYVISGRRAAADGSPEFLRDAYSFSPSAYAKGSGSAAWRRVADVPASVMAGVGFAVEQSHLFVVGGDDGEFFTQADALRDNHPGFPRRTWGYHTITNTWFDAGPIPQNHVTTTAVRWGRDFIVASGEVRPRTRTPDIWRIASRTERPPFGALNYGAIGLYLGALVAIGVFFSRRNRSTDDYFRGGQRVPWWAAGCSIFATMLSSLTFMSVPAKVYATDWVYFLINLCIVALAPFIIAYVLPFFRATDATSAYEYLERRFNLFARLFASACYMLFQVGRMAIVMYLPALALATVTPLSVETCILLMGVLSLVYCTIGGVEAVIWTDTLQTFVLLGGALLSLLIVVFNLEGGATHLLATAQADGKLTLINWDWSAGSFATNALWVIVLGGLAQQLVPYSSDQGVVQRYMSVPSERLAARSIWTNAALSLIASLLFFALGTALYVFYKQHPLELDPGLQNDSVFPQFIASQLPAGIAGLVIAGVFAAAQSTVSTSMNSIATAFTTDFVRRFDVLGSEHSYLRCAQLATLVSGVLGTTAALVLARADVKSLWDTFMGVIGLFGGPMGGLFILGMFTRRANGRGAVIGALASAVLVAVVQRATSVNVVLHTAVGLGGCVAIGYLGSLMFPARADNAEGLSIHSLKPKSNRPQNPANP